MASVHGQYVYKAPQSLHLVVQDCDCIHCERKAKNMADRESRRVAMVCLFAGIAVIFSVWLMRS